MTKIKQFVLSLFLPILSVGCATAATTDSIDGWQTTHAGMNCMADGAALDPKNNYVWQVKFIHAAQDPTTLIVGLFNKEVAAMFKKTSIRKDAKAELVVEGQEFEASQFMFDKDGWLVMRVFYGITLQKNLTENSQMSIAFKPSQNADKFLVSTLYLSKAKSLFNWFHECATQ
ncbi:hypothetical protein [Caballeronia grimmiae]|uniref:hypothetical protein n=1 Tax=Caballeronia grimmiae TaxID=1071679 RepID=UPI0038BCE166